MMVNPDVDGYTTTLNHRKILLKTQKNNNLRKSKRILKPKYRYKLSGDQVLHLLRQGEIFPSAPRLLRHWWYWHGQQYENYPIKPQRVLMRFRISILLDK